MCTFNAVLIVLLKDDLEQQPKASTTQTKESFSLIGSSEDRTLLKEAKDKEYQMSLEMDKKKLLIMNICIYLIESLRNKLRVHVRREWRLNPVRAPLLL